MDRKTCYFIGHREIKYTDELKNKIDKETTEEEEIAFYQYFSQKY